MHPIEYFKLKKLEIDQKYQEKYKKIYQKIVFLNQNFIIKANQEIEKIKKQNEEQELENLLDQLD